MNDLSSVWNIYFKNLTDKINKSIIVHEALLFLISEINTRKRKQQMWTCQVAVPGFELLKRKPKWHNFHNRKKEIITFQRKQLVLNFKSERNGHEGPLNTKYCRIYTHTDCIGQNLSSVTVSGYGWTALTLQGLATEEHGSDHSHTETVLAVPRPPSHLPRPSVT